MLSTFTVTWMRELSQTTGSSSFSLVLSWSVQEHWVHIPLKKATESGVGREEKNCRPGKGLFLAAKNCQDNLSGIKLTERYLPGVEVNAFYSQH